MRLTVFPQAMVFTAPEWSALAPRTDRLRQGGAFSGGTEYGWQTIRFYKSAISLHNQDEARGHGETATGHITFHYRRKNAILTPMKAVTFRFYASLNRFLPPAQRGVTVPYHLNGRTSVKHPIEALGVPHTEVDLILADGEAVTFERLLQAGEQISVYPPFATLDVDGLQWLRPPLSQPLRFVLDVHLGKLATYLRLLGFDALYRNDYEDEELADISAREGRVLLTRDRRLLMRSKIVYGFCLHTRDWEEQLRAVLSRYHLFGSLAPGQRCLRCNGELVPVAKEAIVHRLEPKTKKYFDEFYICRRCQQIYWKGSHYSRMERFIAQLREERPADR